MKNKAAVELGKSGGLKKSEKKTAACRRNASKPRARWVTAISYEAEGISNIDGRLVVRSGLLLTKGKEIGELPKNYDKIVKMITEQWNIDVTEILEFTSISKKI
jgi:hypothetical protein